MRHCGYILVVMKGIHEGEADILLRIGYNSANGTDPRCSALIHDFTDANRASGIHVLQTGQIGQKAKPGLHPH